MVSPQKLIEKEEILMKVIVFRYNYIKRIKNMKLNVFPIELKPHIMITIRLLIPMVILITNLLKAENISFTNNTSDPLSITEPLSMYRVSSLNFPRTSYNPCNVSLSHYEIITKGILKNLNKKVEDKTAKNFTDEKSYNDSKSVDTDDFVDATDE